LGLLKPDQGSISFNTQKISDINPFLYAQSIGFADQQPYIIEGSVEENLLLYAQHKPTSAEMLDVLKKVNLYDDLMERKGLKTHLIEGGMNLSLGQCQRIEIARALLRNPSILILDEATSALDSDVEEKIIDSILESKITLLVASHRQNIFKKCDKIIALEKGQMRGIGSHKSLTAESPYYRELIDSEGQDA
jgi:ABC-type multidrug transport system fused ATPase/permease subunit